MFRLPQKIKEDLENYSRSIEDFLSGRSSWSRFSGIRVPWGNYSHRGGKVFMSRVRIPAGVLSGEQLVALAEASRSYGDGILHITTRQDIQIHNIKAEDIIKVHRFLKDYELSSRGGGGNTVRNIIACPLAGVCPKEVFDVREHALSLTEYLISDDISYNLPRKFKIAFSGCENDCTGLLANDVGLLAVKNNTQSGFRVYAGGGMGAVSHLGGQLENFISCSELGYVICAIRNVFYKYGDRHNKHHNRLRFLIQDLGFEKFKEYYLKELKELKDREYISLRKINLDYPAARSGCLTEIKDKEFQEFLRYNCQEQKQKGNFIVKLRIPRGNLEAGHAEQLGGLKNEFSGIEFRTSPEQNLYILNVPGEILSKLYIKVKNILTDFLYPQTLLDIVACKGSTTCNLGLCNSPGLARELEAVIKEEFLRSKLFEKLDIKVNGCPNACGQHPLAKVSFCGAVRKVKTRPVPFYRLFLGGIKSLENTRLAQGTNIFIPAKNVPLFLRDFLYRIEEETSLDTDIHKFIEEKGESFAREIATNYTYVPDYLENRDFYIDWGRTEEFSLSGLGPGECGAGILDMIEADLTEAKIVLTEAEKEYAPERIRKALFLASRTLLVVKGIDPRTEEEALSGFLEKFVKEGIADSRYAKLKEVFESIREDLDFEEKKEKFLYARGFLSHVEELYKSMDQTFHFPEKSRPVESPLEEVKTQVLDLKNTPCPLNYVKTKLFLENLKKGEILEVLLDEGEPINNVPKSLEADGHKILKIEKEGGFYRVVIEKGE